MEKIQAQGWHTRAKYLEDKHLLDLDHQRETDEKKWSHSFNSLNDYLNFKQYLGQLGVPESREQEYFQLGDQGWRALMLREQGEREARLREQEQARLEQERAKLINADYLLKNYLIPATFACKPEIEKLADYHFEWFDSWRELKFPFYEGKVLKPGVLVISGDKIKIQNAFGALRIHSYRCEYDTQAKTVLNVSIAPR
jgi:hypothetical protein